MVGRILQGPKPNYTIDFNLGQFFFNSTEKFGEKICQIDAYSDEKESYNTLKEKSVRAAIALQQRKIEPKDVIVTCTKVTLDTVVPILASLYLGVKVANLDPSLSVRHTAHLLSLVSPSIIFVQESSVSLIEESLKNVNFKTEIIVFGKSKNYLSYFDFLKPQENEDIFKPVKTDIHDVALIFFTSGTTGLPKAICHSHYSFLHLAYSFYNCDVKTDVILSFTTFYWISAMIFFTCVSIDGGCRIISSSVDGENIFKLIDKYKVTYLFVSPIVTYNLTNFERPQDYDTSSLHNLMTGSTPISAEQFQRLCNLFKYANTVIVYGLSEVGVASGFDPRIDKKYMKTKSGSSGKPLTGFFIKVVDTETNKMLGLNQKGEIRIKAPSLMKGYYNVDSSENFDEDGFLKTGDVGYYDEDDCLYIIDRIKEMFKYLSWHIVPSSIEAILLEHPAVEDAVVFGTPKDDEGELPTAYVVLKENSNVKNEEILEFVTERVSDKERLRGGIIVAQKLLRNPNGKLMRREIRDRYLRSLKTNTY